VAVLKHWLSIQARKLNSARFPKGWRSGRLRQNLSVVSGDSATSSWKVTLLLVIIIFAVNVYLARPVLDSFLFSLALAVGLTPQLLPAIISVNLAHGAKQMALKKVIVKRLASIENFGSMNVLCSDKTGTLL